jgi:protein-tyrosine-phosphatase
VAPQSAADAKNAIDTLRDIGIDASQHVPKGLDAVNPAEFDYVVAMEPSVARKFKAEYPCHPLDTLIKWNIDDPWNDDPAAYKRCAEAIHRKLKGLLT